jgi:hypothetical protein
MYLGTSPSMPLAPRLREPFARFIAAVDTYEASQEERQ